MGGRVIKIALYGRSGSGKSYVAERIAQDYGFKICSSGRICRSITEMLFGNQDKAMLNLVSEKLREIDQDIFINATLADCENEDQIIFDSVRYISDYQALKSRGFVILKVIARDALIDKRLVGRGQIMRQVDKMHRSEWEVDALDFDDTIVNGENDQELNSQIRKIIGK